MPSSVYLDLRHKITSESDALSLCFSPADFSIQENSKFPLNLMVSFMNFHLWMKSMCWKLNACPNSSCPIQVQTQNFSKKSFFGRNFQWIWNSHQNTWKQDQSIGDVGFMNEMTSTSFFWFCSQTLRCCYFWCYCPTWTFSQWNFIMMQVQGADSSEQSSSEK